MKRLSLLVFSLTLCSAASVQAVPPPPPALPHVTPVSWILATRNNLNADDRYVTLVGQVVKRDKGSDWWFTDGTGWVRLDTGDFDLPTGKKLVIGGRVDQAYLGVGYLEVDVKRWHYAKD